MGAAPGRRGGGGLVREKLCSDTIRCLYWGEGEGH